ncbi:MAG TPA: histidinol-phosphatase HisJ family protein [Phycisphaerae bacterium]
MGYFDQHLHSWHSFDSQTPPEENVRRALEVRLTGLTFTEHYDTHPQDWPTCRYDDARYSDEIAALRARFGEQIFIGKGIEVCYQPAQMGAVLDFLERHEFDLVLLSVHWCGDRALHIREHWPERDASRMVRANLETALEAARFCRERRQRGERAFDVLGHLDLAKRYVYRFFEKPPPELDPSIVDEILRTCLEADLIPEVNTSTLRQGLDEPMPGPGVIRRYAELGGTVMSLGSDAHRARDIGADFDRTSYLLRNAGIAQVACYRARALTAEPAHPHAKRPMHGRCPDPHVR